MQKLSGSYVADDDLFRPHEEESSRRQRGQILTSKRRVTKDKRTMQDSDDQFFEL